MMELGWVEIAQFEFGFVLASLSELRPLVEGLLRVGVICRIVDALSISNNFLGISPL